MQESSKGMLLRMKTVVQIETKGNKTPRGKSRKNEIEKNRYTGIVGKDECAADRKIRHET